jgi:hypothetical protein
VGHSIQFRPFSLKLLENFYQGCGILCKKSIYIHIERERERERERESIWKNDVLVQRKWYICLLYVLPQKGCRTKKREKPLWRSLLRTTIWQQPINPHIPFFHKTSLQKKERKKRTSERSNQGNSRLKLEKKELFTMYNLV